MASNIHLSTIATTHSEDITEAQATLQNALQIEKLIEIQNKLYAQHKYSVLIILQGMDTSGKDSTVRKVFSGVNPAGCSVKSFKVPTLEEAAHHFLWRVSKACPEKGMIQIFNRSHYEDLLVPMVNKTITNLLIKERCKEINTFEKGFITDHTILLKFYLHISQQEQLTRIAIRKSDATKRWKYQKEDVLAINNHKLYRKGYQKILKSCSEAAPWHVVPADEKWYKNYSILGKIVATLESYDIDYPEIALKEVSQLVAKEKTFRKEAR